MIILSSVAYMFPSVQFGVPVGHQKPKVPSVDVAGRHLEEFLELALWHLELAEGKFIVYLTKKKIQSSKKAVERKLLNTLIKERNPCSM